jgi:molybdate transport system substrate-binding protein
VTVFAASSLTDAFTQIGKRYAEASPGVDVTFNFLASSDLAAQIEQGAPADVFASADEANMQRIVAAGLADGSPRVFAHNELQIIVPDGNPGDVHELSDLEEPELVVSLCAEECPAGSYAREVLGSARLDVRPDSLEPEVKAVVSRIELGEADAGIVYATDVLAAGEDVEGIPIPDRHNLTATYPIARLAGSPPHAHAFIDFVLSPDGQEILAEYGFLKR